MEGYSSQHGNHHHVGELVEISLDVKSAPSIDVPLRNVGAQEGQAVKLECVVSGELFVVFQFDK